MKVYCYEELTVGQTEAFERRISADMLTEFCRISGDVNPLHTEDAFAQAHGFSGRVVYGMLTASFYSCLAGVYLPGQNCLLQGIKIDFCKPVFVGDRLTVKGEIIEKNDSVRQVVLKAWIVNQDGKKVSRAKIEAGVL